MLRKIEGKRKGQQRIRWLDSIADYEFEQTVRHSEGQGSLVSMGLQRVGHELATEQ